MTNCSSMFHDRTCRNPFKIVCKSLENTKYQNYSDLFPSTEFANCVPVTVLTGQHSQEVIQTDHLEEIHHKFAVVAVLTGIQVTSNLSTPKTKKSESSSVQSVFPPWNKARRDPASSAQLLPGQEVPREPTLWETVTVISV